MSVAKTKSKARCGPLKSRLLRLAAVLIMVGLAGIVSAAPRTTVTIATYSLPRYEILRDYLVPKWQPNHPDIDIQVVNFPDFWNKLLVLMCTDQALISSIRRVRMFSDT